MVKFNYTIIQDGSYVSSEVELKFRNSFEYNDIKKKEGKYFSSFVGFIVYNNEILISFPKHFMSQSEREDLMSAPKRLNKYMNLLFKVIYKSSKKKSSNSIGINEELNNAYPFEAFFYIYKYYINFGLYTGEQVYKEIGNNGKVDWKKTISKSPLLVNKGNIIYMPMVVKKKSEVHLFISKCMAYVIDNTSEMFSFLLDIKRTNYDTKDIDWNNTEYIIKKLKKAERNIFKDTQKQLVTSLINYFEKKHVGKKSIQIRMHTFRYVWEDMVGNYLKNYFNHVDSNGIIHFQSNTREVKMPFEKTKFYPDERTNGLETVTRSLEPDYYLVSEKKRYIFDAKYYQNIKSLNYKQISYYFLLKYYDGILDNSTKEITPLKTYNILLLPTERPMKHKDNFNKHFKLNHMYNLDEKAFDISEQYLNVIDVMNSYI